MVPNDEPKLVNIDKISTALHVYYLNVIVNYSTQSKLLRYRHTISNALVVQTP